jgi:3-oxoadipate enol-lactonase
MIALAEVLAKPRLVRSLTLIGTASTFPEPVRAALQLRAETTRKGGMEAVLESSLERWFTPETRLRRPDLLDRVSQTILSDDPAVHAAIWDLIADNLDVEKRLAKSSAPRLFWWANLILVLRRQQPPCWPKASAALSW